MPSIYLCRSGRWLRAVVPMLVAVSVLRAQADTVVVVDSLSAMSRATLGGARADAAIHRFASFGAYADDLRHVYGDGALVLLWTRDGMVTPAASAMLDALQRVGDRGLDPAEMGVAGVQALAGGVLRTEEARFEFDALLSVASLRTLRALHGMMEPRDAGVGGFDDVKIAAAGNRGIGGRPRVATDSSAALTPPGTDLTHELLALATSTHPDAILDAAEPTSTQYQLLKQSLGTYRTVADADPVASEQLTRILATLDRARAGRDSDEAVSVVVNIPAFRLHAANTAGDRLDMDVVVGAPGVHRTPEMRDSIRYIVFAPYWDVPASIVRAELLPVARRDPRLLMLNNFQIVDRRGRVLPATATSVKQVASGRARIRQLPGGTNSLGRVKFMFPNSEDVYLHDSPVQKDFARDRRDLSHGCVRVGDPVALVRLLLHDQPDWTADRIAQAMNGKTPVTVTLTRPVPIHLTYATAVARRDGSIDFFDDIYGLDTALIP